MVKVKSMAHLCVGSTVVRCLVRYMLSCCASEARADKIESPLLWAFFVPWAHHHCVGQDIVTSGIHRPRNYSITRRPISSLTCADYDVDMSGGAANQRDRWWCHTVDFKEVYVSNRQIRVFTQICLPLKRVRMVCYCKTSRAHAPVKSSSEQPPAAVKQHAAAKNSVLLSKVQSRQMYS